ncbi:hypothetical protein C7B70_23230 [Chlorogloea sp. CCALA 695]|nr:hypothetical protein C7B70_23230 [Chlorogloea sp. CCALA 695]
MHKTLDSRAYRTERHALIAQQHGEAVEALGKTLQQHCCPIIADYGHQIESYGLLIQERAQQSLSYALLLLEQGLSSTDLFIEASQACLQASKLMVQAIKLYSEASKAYVDCNKLAECKKLPFCSNYSRSTAEP